MGSKDPSFYKKVHVGAEEKDEYFAWKLNSIEVMPLD